MCQPDLDLVVLAGASLAALIMIGCTVWCWADARRIAASPTLNEGA